MSRGQKAIAVALVCSAGPAIVGAVAELLWRRPSAFLGGMLVTLMAMGIILIVFPVSLIDWFDRDMRKGENDEN